jgi:PPM family protein phosphatase
LIIQAFGLTDRGAVRPNNEDYFLIHAEEGLYIVADGMGGARAGEQASRMAVDTLAAALHEATRPGKAELAAAFREANSAVLSAASQDYRLEGMGTTLIAALEQEEDLLVASVGDSRAYLLLNDQLSLITEDQTWVNEVGRGLGLQENTLRTHPMRHVLTMAIGVGVDLRICERRIPLTSGMQLLLCSDGLHGVLADTEIQAVLQEERSPEEKCQRLIRVANEAGGPDNITVVLLQVH